MIDLLVSRGAADPIGLQNDFWIERAVVDSDILIVAWGNDPEIAGGSSREVVRDCRASGPAGLAAD